MDVDVLVTMGDPETEWWLPEMHGLTREHCMEFLDRAAEVGLLTALGGGYYTIHPALPWFFKGLFDLYYPASEPEPGSEVAVSLARAFAEAMDALGDFYSSEYDKGNRGVIEALTYEEAKKSLNKLLECSRPRLSQARFQQRIAVVPDLFRCSLTCFTHGNSPVALVGGDVSSATRRVCGPSTNIPAVGESGPGWWRRSFRTLWTQLPVERSQAGRSNGTRSLSIEYTWRGELGGGPRPRVYKSL